MKAPFTLVLMLLSIGTHLEAQSDDSISRATLVGSRGVHVIVVRFDSTTAALNASTVQTDVELKLRMAGIPILSDSVAAVSNSVYLYVTLDLFTRMEHSGVYAFAIRVEGQQLVRLVRNPRIYSYAVTWSAPLDIGTVGKENLRKVRQSISDRVDQFVNAYLAANPKR